MRGTYRACYDKTNPMILQINRTMSRTTNGRMAFVFQKRPKEPQPFFGFVFMVYDVKATRTMLVIARLLLRVAGNTKPTAKNSSNVGTVQTATPNAPTLNRSCAKDIRHVPWSKNLAAAATASAVAQSSAAAVCRSANTLVPATRLPLHQQPQMPQVTPLQRAQLPYGFPTRG